MYHNLIYPEITVGVVPELKDNSLMISRKFTDIIYTVLLTPKEVCIYDGNEVK